MVTHVSWHPCVTNLKQQKKQLGGKCVFRALYLTLAEVFCPQRAL